MRAVRLRPATAGVAVAYTPMHGVGGELVLRAFEAAGPAGAARRRPSSSQPDPTFPTVAFPNPEEPGAMDLVIALAAEQGAAARARQRSRRRPARGGDPAARRVVAAARRRRDRLAARRPHPPQPVPATAASDRLVVTTLVSSSLLEQMAADHGVHFAETFTGFKWIGRDGRSTTRTCALRVRLRAGARLPRRRRARSTRTASPPRCCWPRSPPSPPRRARRCRAASTTSPPATAATSSPTARCMMEPARAAERVRELLADPPDGLGGAKVVDVTVVSRGRPAAPDARGRGAGPGPPERHRAQGQALRRGVDADPTPYLDALADLLS